MLPELLSLPLNWRVREHLFKGQGCDVLDGYFNICIFICIIYYIYGMMMRDARVLHDEASRSGHFVLFPEGFSLRRNSSCLDSSIRARCKSHLI